MDKTKTYTVEFTGKDAKGTGADVALHGVWVKVDGATGINSAVAEVESADADAPAYNLAGQKVGDNAKGIIIQNGKKYIRK